MTADEAIAIVNSKSQGRTRREGQGLFLDEVLVSEIEWSRANCETWKRVAQRHHDALKELQAELDDAAQTLQLHQINGDYEAGRRLGEKAASEKIEWLQVENKRIKAAMARLAMVTRSTQPK